MTIRFRNRLTLAFFVLSITSLFVAVFFTGFQFFSTSLDIPAVYTKGLSQSFLLEYRPWCVFSGIFLMMAYTCVTSLVILHSFEKTQAPDITFFMLFLLACLCDSSRIAVQLLNLTGNYTQLLLKIGNLQLFARLLAPLALMGNIILSTDNLKQSTDQNCIILIIIAIFFADFIPLNTAVILPNFGISYGYGKSIRAFSAVIILMSSLELFISNKRNDYKQTSTIGFIMLSAGYSLIFYCYNIINLSAGAFLLTTGSILYLNDVHKRYLWID